MRRHVLLIVIGGFLFLISCTGGQYDFINNPKNCTQYSLGSNYINEELGFSVSLPEDYSISENFEALNLAAVKNSSDSTYLEAFGVTVEVNSLNYKLTEFYQVSLNNDKEDYMKNYGDFRLVDEGALIINDHDIRWNVYSYGDEKALNYLTVSGGRTYRMMFLSNANDFDSLSCKFIDVMASMNFLQ